MGRSAVPVSEADALRELITEARQTTKDLRSAMRDFEDLIIRRADNVFVKNMNASFIQMGRAVEDAFHTIERNAKQAFKEGIDRCIKAIETAAEHFEKCPPETIRQNIDNVMVAFVKDSDQLIDNIDRTIAWHRSAQAFLAKKDPLRNP